VGQFAIRSATLLGASHIIAIDNIPARLRMAAQDGDVTPLNCDVVDVVEALRDLTGGRGPDVCIEAVGLEAHAHGLADAYERGKQIFGLASDRVNAVRQAIFSCRKGGRVSLAGAFGGFANKIPLGAAMNKALTITMGQTHVHRYMPHLLNHIRAGDLDPSFVVTHRASLNDAPAAYKLFSERRDDCVKVVLQD
jgi:threonine dehydrogenase-like Zn-dependent dehydrogenase